MPGAPRFQHSSLRGAAAVVIDGGCRDIDEIRATKLWLASRFVTPLSGKTRLRVESIGDPAHLGGLLVRAGDLVVGDETGIVIVPRVNRRRSRQGRGDCRKGPNDRGHVKGR